ncbi:MAG: protein kinase [Planctomycetota bacterium]|nr:protein kinase [Planctomycetota bacterium]
MDPKQPPAASPTDTHSDQDKYATTHQAISAAVPLWIQLKLGANLPLSLGRYDVQRVLGAGAMAAVYLAEDRQLGRQVAIKIPKFESNDQAGMKRFFREARTMATLRHPHLCPVYDVGEIEGVHYFTMAYIEGGTLADRIASDGPMSCRRVAVLVAKIASALHAAHQTGTVHRDLKPANVMIDQNNEPVVMDFGLAGLAEAESNLTRAGEMIGTPAYMSPEQITGSLNAVGPASDVYSLGAIMYEMLTGQLPFGGSVASVVQQALILDPTAPTAVRGDIDPALEAICLKAMSRAPRDRFASSDELAIALRDYLRGVAAPPLPAPVSETIVGEDRWAADAARVRELWRGEQFAAALAILEPLAQLTGPNGLQYAEWAKHEIPKVRAQIEHANQTIVQAAAWNSGLAPQRVSPRIRRPVGAKARMPMWLPWVMVAAAAMIGLLIVFVVASNWSNPSSGAIAGAARIVDVPKAEPVVPPTPRVEDGIEPDSIKELAAADDPVVIEELPARPAAGERPPLPPDESDPLRRLPPRPGVDEIMKAHDANNDGQLTPEEIPRPERPHLMRADTDRDGVVTREELDIMFLFTPGPPPRR